MNTSQAAVFSGVRRQTELREFIRPEPTDGEILVRILGCTLCGSDLHTLEGRRSAPTPTILGHEIVGEIVALDTLAPRHDLAGQALHLGDRVTWTLVANCGECFFCRHSLPQKCLRATKYGHEPLRPGRELVGGFAAHCLLVPGTGIVRLPEELPLEVACPANCATATAVASLEAAGELQGCTVCVLGAGLLGLTACAIANSRDADQVICVELQSDRRARAAAFGATCPVAPDELADAVKRLTNGRGVDVLVEATGSPAAFSAAWPLVRIGGSIVLVGSVFPSPPVELPLEQVVRRHLILRGIHNYRSDHLLTAVQFLAKNHQRFPFAELVTQWHPLSRLDDALKAGGDPSNIRVGIRNS